MPWFLFEYNDRKMSTLPRQTLIVVGSNKKYHRKVNGTQVVLCGLVDESVLREIQI